MLAGVVSAPVVTVSDLDRGTESSRTDDQRERVAPFLSDRRIPKPVKSGSLRNFHLFFRCGFLAGPPRL